MHLLPALGIPPCRWVSSPYACTAHPESPLLTMFSLNRPSLPPTILLFCCLLRRCRRRMTETSTEKGRALPHVAWNPLLIRPRDPKSECKAACLPAAQSLVVWRLPLVRSRPAQSIHPYHTFINICGKCPPAKRSRGCWKREESKSRKRTK